MYTIIPADYFGLQRYELSAKSPNYIDYNLEHKTWIYKYITSVNIFKLRNVTSSSFNSGATSPQSHRLTPLEVSEWDQSHEDFRSQKSMLPISVYEGAACL